MAGSYQLQREAWTSRTTATLVVLVLAACASLAVLVHPWYEAVTETNDAAMYIACAKALLAGEGYAYLGELFTIRPPGFSVLIAPVLAWRGVDFAALNAFVALFGVATVALLFAWLHPRLGTALALAVAAAVWMNPGFQRLCNTVLSDVPGAALMLGCLLLERWSARSPGWKRDAILGLAIGLAAYVRSVDVLLVPAIVCARAAEHAAQNGRTGSLRFLRGRVLVLALTTVAVLAPWIVRNALVAPATPVDQNFLHSYSTAMWHTDGGDPASPLRPASEIVERIPKRLPQVLSMLGSRMTTSRGSAVELALGALALACLAVVLVRRREPAEWMALGTTAVLVTYFGFQDRLVLGVWLIAFPAVVECVASLTARATDPRVARLVATTLVLALAVVDASPRRGWRELEIAHEAYARVAAGFAAGLAPDARVAAPIGWHYAVFLERPVYSLFFAVRRADDVAAVERVIDKYDIDTVVLWSGVPADQAMLAYFLERYRGEPVPGGGLVFRVRP
jgi:hypothetical protein